jgi:hypothetical protein
MKTTIRVDDRLLQRAWQEAERRGIPLASLIEQALQLVLRLPFKAPEQRTLDLPVCHAEGEIRPHIDLKKNPSLIDRTQRRD